VEKVRIPLIAGNWKMYKTNDEALDMVRELAALVKGLEGVQVAVCPPFTALADIGRLLSELESKIWLGAQNVYPEPEGAFTGEISPTMLSAAGVYYVIVGHSERREILRETDEMVAKKLRAVFANNMVSILCVGETLEEREAGRAQGKVEDQLKLGLSLLDPKQIKGMVIAYEPIWAIGTGKTATPDDAQEMCGFIRRRLQEEYCQDGFGDVRILYGGSVKAQNIKDLMAMEDIDGALVGGASLNAEEFARIANYRE
jgi:triosephosphate isomerase (TIM)